MKQRFSKVLSRGAAEVAAASLDEANRWTAVEDEFQTILSGIARANLIRRQRAALIASQAFSIGAQLAADPAHGVLVPHVQDARKQRRLTARGRLRM